MSEPPNSSSQVSHQVAARMAIEIPKPKDWQAFQRNCVLLFREELGDPNIQEFGRSGQDQGGIDLLGCRSGSTSHYVGIQCRHITKPLKQSKILSDTRAALALGFGIKELIFATTAPDDTKATVAAIAVERELAEEGHNLRIVVFGWEQIQKLICRHDVAYHAFHPYAVSTSVPVASALPDATDFAATVVAGVFAKMQATGMVGAPLESSNELSAEDPSLHAKIDTLRELFKDQALPLPAQKGLQALAQLDLQNKPWARYRIETILASIDLKLGKEKEAAVRFRFAHSLRPTDPKAIANLALAQTVDGQYDEAMATARQALNATPPEEHAVTVLLQAAARSDWCGDPLELIPDALRDTFAGDFSLAEFMRRRELPGWEQVCIDKAERYPEKEEFKILRATAILGLVVAKPERPAVASEQIALATEVLRETAEQLLSIDFADKHDLMAHVNNAAVLMRFAGRHKESELLLERGIAACGEDAQLRRLLALSQYNQERPADAIRTLSGATDPENILLRAELLNSIGDYKEARTLAQSVPEDDVPVRLRRLHLSLLAENSMRLSDWSSFDSIVERIREADATELEADLWKLRKLRAQTRDQRAVQEAVQQLVQRVDKETDLLMRFNIATEAYRSALPGDAADLLAGHVDLHQAWPPTFLYLESLASARRDSALLAQLDCTSEDVRDDPRLRWVVVAHAWNRGSLFECLTEIELLLKRVPNHPSARLLKIEVLLRQDRSSDVLAELDADLERLPWKDSRDEFRLASLLNHFGYKERAAALAYRLFLKHRDLSPAWMTLSGIVMDVGPHQDERRWTSELVGLDAAVDLLYDDGTKLFFVIETDPELRGLDVDSWEPSHQLAVAVRGLKIGARFVDPDGRGGVISKVRHKYVARLHFVLQNYETRFPTVFGVKQVAVEVGKEGGLDHLIAELEGRRDYVALIEERYFNSSWPLEAFASLIGVDPIDAAAALATRGRKLKVAVGTVVEREAARNAIKNNGGRGCVVDLQTFWTAHCLKALDTLVAVCGPVHVTQITVDRLRARRHELDAGATGGASSASLIDGQFTIIKTTAEQFVAMRDDMDVAIGWIAANATIETLEISDNLPPLFQEALRNDSHAIFASLGLAVRKELLLVTDDLATRQVGHSMGAHNCTWLHTVLSVALERKSATFDQFVEWSGGLALAGHNFLSITGDIIAQSARRDHEKGVPVSSSTVALARQLGGKEADRQSHAFTACRALMLMWNDDAGRSYSKLVTSHVLRALVRERVVDGLSILDAVEQACGRFPELVAFIKSWRVGHFLVRLPTW